MVSLEWDCERTDGVTLVSLFVTSERECRVRVANRLDGPVWPPRRRGQPVAGWTDGDFTGLVPADGRLAVGYATSAPPADPPAEVVSTGPPETDDGRARTGGATLADGGCHETVAPAVAETPADVVRTLGDPVVPRDCVPLPDESSTTRATGRDRESTDHGRSETTAAGHEAVERAPADASPGRRESRDDSGRSRLSDSRDGDALLVPGAVRAWLRDVERRLDAAADAGADADDSPGRRAGLADAAAADRRALSWVDDRIDAVTQRTEAVTQRTGTGRGPRAGADRES